MAVYNRKAALSEEPSRKETILARTVILSLALFIMVMFATGLTIFLLTHGTRL